MSDKQLNDWKNNERKEQRTIAAKDDVKEVGEYFIDLCKQTRPDKFIEQRKYDVDVITKHIGLGKCTQSVFDALRERFPAPLLVKAGFISKSGTIAEKFLGRVIFPYNNSKGTYYFSAREEKDARHPDKKVSTDFPIKDAFGSKPAYKLQGSNNTLIVAEGETSAIALRHIFDDHNIMAVGGVGSAIKFVREIPDELDHIIVCFDNDPAGEQMLDKVLAHLGDMEKKTSIIKFDEEVNDIDDLWREYQKDTINQITIEEVTEFPELRPEVQLPQDNRLVTQFIGDLTPILSKKEEIFYRETDMSVVRVKNIFDDTNKISGVVFDKVNPEYLISYIEKHIDTYRSTPLKDGAMIKKFFSTNSTTTKIVLQSDQFRDELKKISRIFTIPQPMYYRGKLAYPNKGYDNRFNSWLVEDAIELNDSMTLEEARENILFIFREFCFKDEQSRTNAIAGLITPFIRGLYSRQTCRTPLFLYEANRERCGKDYCAGITGILYYGNATEEPAISNSDNKKTAGSEELRKKLMSSLIAGKKRLHFSNNTGFINNAVLEGFITQEHFSDRVLGVNRILEFPNEIELSLSANLGLDYTADLSNRLRKIELFLAQEDPNKREFETKDMHGYVLENRQKIINSVFKLVKDWVDKGSVPGATLFTSFPEWARVCGGIMQNANLGDPCIADLSTQSIGGDQKTKDFKTLFEIMKENKPNQFITKKELQQIVREAQDEYEIFKYLDLEDKSGQTRFSLELKKFIGRELSNVVLMIEDKNIRAARQKIGFFIKDGAYEAILGENRGNVGNVGNVLPIATHGSISENINISNIRDDEKTLPKVTKVTKQEKKALTLHILLDSIRNAKQPISVEDLFIELEKEYIFTKSQFDNYIDSAKEEGDIFELKPGYLSII